MFLQGSARWLALAVAWMAPGVAGAQLVSVTVEGASEEARAFTTAYVNAAGQDGWAVRGSLVRVYRVDQLVGTIKIRAVLEPNSAPRVAQGPTSQQSMRLHTAWDDRPLGTATAPAPPDKPVEANYEFTYGSNGTNDIGERVVVFATEGYAARCGTGFADCGKVEGFLVFLLRRSPQLAFGGSIRPALFQIPARFVRLQFPVQGLSPLTEVRDVLIDGIPMKRIPESLTESPGNGEWYRNYPADPTDPITPSEVIYPSFGAFTSVDRFLGCGGGGCGMGGVTVGLPADLGPGLHSITVEGSRWPETFYTFFGGPLTTAPAPGEPAGDAELDATEDFIIVDPQISVSPPQAEPGSTITITGTGFAPESPIPVRFAVSCCSIREPLGTATTDVTGTFILQATLPTAPFASVWSPSVSPGTTTAGQILAMLGDTIFLQKYSLPAVEYSGNVTFVKPGGTASTTTTVPGATTTTTVPVACNPGDACGDGDPCTRDACTGGVCTHTALTGPAAVICGVPATGLRPAVCTIEVPPRRAEKLFGKATSALQRAVDRTLRVTKRLVKKADKLLGRAQNVVDGARFAGKLSSSCADGIDDVIGGVRSQLGVVLSGL